jgi:hypothetical protein
VQIAQSGTAKYSLIVSASGGVYYTCPTSGSPPVSDCSKAIGQQITLYVCVVGPVTVGTLVTADGGCASLSGSNTASYTITNEFAYPGIVFPFDMTFVSNPITTSAFAAKQYDVHLYYTTAQTKTTVGGSTPTAVGTWSVQSGTQLGAMAVQLTN